MNNKDLTIGLTKDTENAEIFIKQKIPFLDKLVLFTLESKEDITVNKKTNMFVGGE